MDDPVRTTSRLLLRLPTLADQAFAAALYACPEVVAHRPVPTPDTPQQSAKRLCDDIEHWGRLGFGRWAIEASGRLIGFGGLTLSEKFAGLNLSYHLHPEIWRRGFATEFGRAALEFAFAVLGADRVMGLVRPANHASRRVLEKCGFEFVRDVDLHGAPADLYRAMHPGALPWLGRRDQAK